MAGIKRDKPADEFWNRTRELIEWCSPEELRILRVMAATEMEKRLRVWDNKLAISDSEAKAKKNRSIRRQIARVKNVV